MPQGIFVTFLVLFYFMAAKTLLESFALFVGDPFFAAYLWDYNPGEGVKLWMVLSFVLPLIPFFHVNRSIRKKRGYLKNSPFSGILVDSPATLDRYLSPARLKNPVVLLVILIALPLSTQVLGSEIDRWVHGVFECDESYRAFVRFFGPTGNWPDLLGAYLAVGIVGPIAEEVLYRGIIQTGLIHHYGRRYRHLVVIAQGLLFGALHLTRWQIFYAMPMGILLGYLRLWSGSLLPSILVHMANNLAAVILMYHFSGSPAEMAASDPCTATESVPVYILFPAIALVFVSLLYLYKKSVSRISKQKATRGPTD